MKEKQSGQIVIILLLVMVLALAIGLAIIGRSISEVSTSAKSENSSRAFSAAEAGLEKIMAPSNISTSTNIPTTVLPGNDSVYSANKNENPPLNSGRALEYLKAFKKGEIAQFWLVDPDDLNCSVDCYKASGFNLYFGDPDADYVTDPNTQPAMEINVVYYDKNTYEYTMERFFIDSKTPSPNTRFGAVGGGISTCDPPLKPPSINTNIDSQSSFYCKKSVTLAAGTGGTRTNLMVRVKSLYSDYGHKVALQPTGGDNLPVQGYIFQSTGKSGTSLRKIMVQQQKDTIPHYFDYVLYSDTGLNK